VAEGTTLRASKSEIQRPERAFGRWITAVDSMKLQKHGREAHHAVQKICPSMNVYLQPAGRLPRWIALYGTAPDGERG
jgi:hypothetical protein